MTDMDWTQRMRWTRGVLCACALGFASGCADSDIEDEPENGATSSAEGSGSTSDNGGTDPSGSTEPAEPETEGPSETDDSDGETTDTDETGEPPPWEGLEGDAARGAVVFEMTCGKEGCHGAGGKGPSLDGYVPGATDESIASIVFNGIPGGCNSGFCPGMPAQDLDAQEFADVLAYLRETFIGE